MPRFVRSIAALRTLRIGIGEGAEPEAVVVVVAHRVAVQRDAEFTHSFNKLPLVVGREVIGVVQVDAVQALDPGGPPDDVEGRRFSVEAGPVVALVDAEGIEARGELRGGFGFVHGRSSTKA